MLDMVNVLTNYKCGELDFGIPGAVFNLVHYVVLIIQIVVPILLIIWGMLDFAKAVVGGDEDKIKAGQKVFIKRLIAAVLVFLVVTVVKLLVGLVGQLGVEGAAGNDSVWACVEKFINGTK